MNQILIATDGSSGGSEAVEQGLALARSSGARVTVVYVRKPASSIVGDAYYQRSLSVTLANARQILDESLAHATEVGVDAEGEILEGDAAEQIAGLARSRNADMIVVGTRALGPLTGTLLGSVSRAVVHTADRPVLVVTPRPQDRRTAA